MLSIFAVKTIVGTTATLCFKNDSWEILCVQCIHIQPFDWTVHVLFNKFYFCLFIFLTIFPNRLQFFVVPVHLPNFMILNCVLKKISSLAQVNIFFVCSLVFMGCISSERKNNNIKQWKPNRFKPNNVIIWIENKILKIKQTNMHMCRLFNPLFEWWYHYMPQGWVDLSSISLFSYIHVPSWMKKNGEQKSHKGRMCSKLNIKWWYCDLMEIGNMTPIHIFSLSRGSDKITKRLPAANLTKENVGGGREREDIKANKNGIINFIRRLRNRWHINNTYIYYFLLLTLFSILYHIFYNIIC